MTQAGGRRLTTEPPTRPYFILFFKRFYLFVRERERAQAGGAVGGGRSRLPAEQGAQLGLNSRLTD